MPGWLSDYPKILLALLTIGVWDTFHGVVWGSIVGNPAGSALRMGWDLMLPYSLWGFLAPICLWATDARRLDSRPLWKAAGVHLLAMALYCGTFLVLFFGIREFTRGPLSTWMTRFLGDFSLARQDLGAWGASAWINWFICTSFAHLLAFFRDMRNKELRASHLEAQLAHSQLHSLKAQVQPHFLFNTLNSIYALVPTEATEARRMVVLLSDFLRRALQESSLQMVTLRKELEFVEMYLGIQQLRFSNRMRIERDVEEEVLDWMLPHLLLQPLVENAIKHGLGPKVGLGVLRIIAYREKGLLLLSVEDDGVGPSEATSGLGFGLKSTADRLRQLYGDKATLAYGALPSGGFRVSMEIPTNSEVLPSLSATSDP